MIVARAQAREQDPAYRPSPMRASLRFYRVERDKVF